MFTALLPVVALVAPAEATPSVAILDLVNATGDPAFDGAGPGVAGLLVTRFQQTESVSVVERDALQAVIGELKLSSSGMVNPATASRTGRLVGARYLVTGELFSVALPSLAINLRIIDTETGTVVAANEVTGEVGSSGEQFFTLVDQLSDDILAALDVQLSEGERANWSAIEHRELDAVIKYGKRLTRVALDHPKALYRDKSLDFAPGSYSSRWMVMDNSGKAVPMPSFARRVGDTRGADDFALAVQRTTKTHRRNNWIAGGVCIGGLGASVGAIPAESPGLFTAGAGLIIAGLFNLAGNRIGRATRVHQLSYPGAFYTPEEADRIIAEYNLGLD